tara:strand:- start:203875 stop:205326 length:1452 start_codon:yes stop_codon:yes gene_type:complete
MTRQTVAIVGASGYVGKSFIEKYHDQYDIVAISRTQSKDWPDDVEWRQTDLYSAQSIQDSLQGVDIAIYLVHSMIPSTRLFQGNFADTDLLLADNFARSAISNNVKKIIYLSGPIPKRKISKHLKSRAEVERLLHSTGIPFHSIRAGMVVGRGGSSFEILENLVKKLPIMILPRWAKNKTHCIFISDLIKIIDKTIEGEKFSEPVINAITGETLTYERMIKVFAKTLGRKVYIINVPLKQLEFSKRWVSLFGKAPYELVSPLIDSLDCEFEKEIPSTNVKASLGFLKFKRMVAQVEKFDKISSKNAFLRKSQDELKAEQKRYRKKINNTVRSIQRLPSLPHKSSQWIASSYIKWLPKRLRPFIKIKKNESKNLIHFTTPLLPLPLLTLKFIENNSSNDRQKFFIVGGILSKTKDTGWLEFRQICNKKYTIAAIHEFNPSLPWFIYIYTQAIAHEFVMNSFSKYLSKFKKKKGKTKTKTRKKKS